MNLENKMLSEKSPSQKGTGYIIDLKAQNWKIRRDRK